MTLFEPYTLSVSSPYATLDYEVTSPTFSVYISPDVNVFSGRKFAFLPENQ